MCIIYFLEKPVLFQMPYTKVNLPGDIVGKQRETYGLAVGHLRPSVSDQHRI